MPTVNLAPDIDDDGWNGPVLYLWEQVQGPRIADIAGPSAPIATSSPTSPR